jgi:hypothetical protein
MISVCILDCCKFFDGEAYIFVGEGVDANVVRMTAIAPLSCAMAVVIRRSGPGVQELSDY